MRGVDNEVRAIRADAATGAPKASLRDGRLVSKDADSTTYLFACSTWPEALDGKNLLVRPSFSRRAWRPVVAERVAGGQVQVVVEGDLGDLTGRFQLRVDEAASWLVLRDRLSAAVDEGSSLDLEHAGWVLDRGRRPEKGRAVRLDRLVPGFVETCNPNPRQVEAVAGSLADEMTFIWGPPGTGKTDVVSRVVEGSWRQGCTVLFLAPTNVAVDQALLRICGLLHEEDTFQAGLVQRVGTIEVAALSTAYGDQVVAELITTRLKADHDHEITRLSASLAEGRDQLRRQGRAAAVRGARDDLNLQRQKIRGALSEHEASSRRLEVRIARARAKLDRTEEAARTTDPRSSIRRRVEDRRSNLKALLEDPRHSNIVVLRQSAADVDLRLERSAADLLEVERDVAGLPPVLALQTSVDETSSRIDEVRAEAATLSTTVRRNVRVVATTVAMAVQSSLPLDHFDVVIVDEAGMVNLPSAWLVAGRARRRLVLAGDFRQLPAVTQASTSRALSESDKTHNATWVDRDAFHSAGLVDSAGRVRAGGRLVALDTQYRMRRAICDVVNHVAYPDAPLETGRPDEPGLRASRLLRTAVTLVDTSACRVPVEHRSGAHRSNDVHEQVIHEIIRGLQSEDVLPARKSDEAAVTARLLGVIAPYNDQVRALSASLDQRLGGRHLGLADTIHRFQGSERPIIVFDTVAGAGDRTGMFYEGQGLGSATCRLINVALSRARDHLVVVADVAFLRRTLPADSPAREMLEFLASNAVTVPAERLVPVRSADELSALGSEDRDRPAFFPADEVDRAVRFDLEHAVRQVDIYCAFLSPQGLTRWKKALEACLARGVQTTVYTREQQVGTPGHHIAEQLRTLGCTVQVRERMHEKVLIADDTVLWHGSLNLLASDGPTDLMMRVADPDACLRVRHIVDGARMERPAWKRPEPGRSGKPGGPAAGEVRDGRLYLDVPFPREG